VVNKTERTRAWLRALPKKPERRSGLEFIKENHGARAEEAEHRQTHRHRQIHS
jgi:hypothetical protein